MNARLIFKRARQLLGGAVVAMMVAFVAFVAINWRDRPPNSSAQRLEAALAARAEVPPADNAFVHILALTVPLDKDVVAVGTARAAWLAQGARAAEGDAQGFPDDLDAIDEKPPAELLPLFQACRDINRSCAAMLESDIEQAQAWLASVEWLSARYAATLATRGWHEIALTDVRADLPRYSPFFEGQRLLFVQAWLLARRGDAAAVAAMLEQDLAFWRRMQLSSANLLTKTMANAGIRRHFQSASVVLRALPAHRQASAIPAQWKREFSSDERSMLLALAGEYHLVKHTLAAPWQPDDPDSWWRDALEKAGGVKVQDTANRYADYAVNLAAIMAVDYAGVRQAAERARALAPVITDASIASSLFNPVGKLALENVSGFVDYGLRITDLESLRRTALLAAQLRAQGVSPGDIPARLQAGALRNAYDGRPFAWDADSGRLLAGGLAEANKARSYIEY